MKQHKDTCATITLAEHATNRWWPICDCAVDPREESRYDAGTNNGESRSNTVTEQNAMAEAADYEDDEMEFSDEEGYNVVSFLADLETFLESKLDGVTRGNVFLSENKNGVTVNLLIGTPFAESEIEVNQVNVIIAPTDRAFLGSEGVSMGADDLSPNEDGEVFFDTREQARDHARSSGARFADKGQDAEQGARWSTHEAFDNAMSHFNGE